MLGTLDPGSLVPVPFGLNENSNFNEMQLPITEEQLKLNKQRIEELMDEDDDSNYCLLCTKYLFHDVPSGDECIMCGCGACYCVECVTTYDIEHQDGILEECCGCCSVFEKKNEVNLMLALAARVNKDYIDQWKERDAEREYCWLCLYYLFYRLPAEVDCTSCGYGHWFCDRCVQKHQLEEDEHQCIKNCPVCHNEK